MIVVVLVLVPFVPTTPFVRGEGEVRPQLEITFLMLGGVYSSSSSSGDATRGCGVPIDAGGDGPLACERESAVEDDDEGWRERASVNVCATSMTVARLPVLGIRACRAGLGGGFCPAL